jgi:hypothetical protein
MACIITVTFNHPPAADMAVAQVTVVGTDGAFDLLPGESVDFDVQDSGDYEIFGRVRTLPTTEWSIAVTASGGYSQTKNREGTTTVLFSDVTVICD